jgi:glycosyltransferase involved in cell wall biosynthesis
VSRAGEGPVPILRVYTRLEVGGIERQLLRLLPRLESRGRYSTTLLLTQREGTLARAFREAGLRVELVPLRGRLGRRAVSPLAARIRDRAPRLVHAHMYDASTTATAAALLAGRTPVIASIHNLGVIEGRRRVLQERLLNRFRAAVVCVSEVVRRDYLARVGGAPEKVVVLYNGIDIEAVRAVPPDPRGVREEFGLPADALVAVCVARLRMPQKAHGDLLEAFAAVARRNPRAHLLLVGEGPERAAIEFRIRAPDLEGRVVLAGEREDVFRLLRSCDVGTLASVREGFSNVVLECLAAGLPLAVTEVGGNREAMEGESTGLLVPPRDPPALALALERLLGDEELRRSLSEACARRASRFDIERTLDDTEALYDRILGEGAPSAREPRRSRD